MDNCGIYVPLLGLTDGWFYIHHKLKAYGFSRSRQGEVTVNMTSMRLLREATGTVLQLAAAEAAYVLR